MSCDGRISLAQFSIYRYLHLGNSKAGTIARQYPIVHIPVKRLTNESIKRKISYDPIPTSSHSRFRDTPLARSLIN